MRYTLSGVGDMLGKYISLADWKIAHLLTNEYFCPYLYSLTWQALERVRNSCLQLRTGSLNAFRDLTEGLLLSGLSIQMCGNTRPASGAEHHISHALEMGIPVYSDAMHGEKVAVGTCLCAEVYRSIAKIEDISPLVLPYTPISGCFLKNISPELQEFILQENVDDCLAAVESFKAHKPLESRPRDTLLYSRFPTAPNSASTIRMCRLFKKYRRLRRLG